MGLKVLLDTNAIIALLKNEGNIQALLNSCKEQVLLQMEYFITPIPEPLLN